MIAARSAPARAVIAAVALVGLAAVTPALAAAARPAPTARRFAPGGGPDTTWWASPVSRVALRRQPTPHARATGRTHLYTEDGFPEVDIVTREAATGGGLWLHVLQPTKPHAIGGWVRARFMTALTQVHTRLVVDRAAERATLYRDGRPIWRAPVGVGKPSTPTPPGRYWVREKFTVPGDGLYGTRAFGTSDYSPYETDWPEGGIVGIHGTDEPQLIPGRPSHGCIRVRNPAIERLYRLMPVGTPVIIH